MGQAEPDEAVAAPAAPRLYPGKRMLDIVAGLILSIVTLPIVLVLASISAVKFRASPFFVQERVGLDGGLLRCVKIRSLPKTTPTYLDKTALHDHLEPTAWCRFLRRSHLDELPQFWQTVTGAMSLVGPRPMIAMIVAEIPQQQALVRHSVRPGVTGPWQVSVDNARSVLGCLDYDELYVRNASLALDLKLLLLTAAQTVGAAKRDREQVMAMMSSSPVDADDEVAGGAVSEADPDCAQAHHDSCRRAGPSLRRQPELLVAEQPPRG